MAYTDLLTESRVSEQFKPRRTKGKKVVEKPTKEERIVRKEELKAKTKWTVVYQSDRSHIDEFIDLYKKNPLAARVTYFQNTRNYAFTRIVLFEYTKTRWELVQFEVKFGVSTTNRMYSSERKLQRISYREGRGWFIMGNRVEPLSYPGCQMFIGGLYCDAQIKVEEVLRKAFHFYRTVEEFPLRGATNFNTIIRLKLFGINKMYRHLLQVPPRIGKEVVFSKTWDKLHGHDGSKVKAWRVIVKQLSNPECLTKDMLNNSLFLDTYRMGRTLGQNINCRWSKSRLKQEHDLWAREITDILLANKEEYELNTRPVFKEFSKFSGYPIFKTNKELYLEGLTQNHCVGTYTNGVDNGSYAIYRVGEYTLQVRRSYNYSREKKLKGYQALKARLSSLWGSKQQWEYKLCIAQIAGVGDNPCPKDVRDEVQATLDRFMDKIDVKQIEEEEKKYNPKVVSAAGDNELPF